MQPDVRRLPVTVGVSLHARIWPAVPERSSARPFLLVHGLSSNCRTWDFVAHRLQAEGHFVVAVDLRGHGQSDKPETGYDFATLTADLLAVIDSAGLDRPVVAGQSTGGNLAVELAHRAPDRIAAAIGVDGGALELQFRWPTWDECEAALAPPRFDGTPADELTAAIREAHPEWPDAAVAATLANCEVLADGTVRPHPWPRRRAGKRWDCEVAPTGSSPRRAIGCPRDPRTTG
ncbi:MAG: alpha/beta hydrolase, partial [Actinobacteria bacterium]|nr:alpha/beta hydrolase [Actinomycetota bacterium]